MTSPNNDPNYDPLAAAAKRQSVSFKNVQQGDRKRLQVQSLSREAQQADYDTGKPAFWPSDVPGQPGNPKMAVVFDVFDESSGEPRALWCPKPSSMLNAVAAAQSKAGQRIQPGGILEVWIDGYKKSNDPKKEDQKLYAAEYHPAAEPQPADPLTGGGASSPPAAAAAPARDEPPF
jgi:hypothetical protein